MAFCLNTVIVQASGAMEEDRTLEGITCLALVQVPSGPTPFLRMLDPVEHEQGPHDTADFAPRGS